MHVIDLNSDLGESFGPWKMGMDAEVMKKCLLCERGMRLSCWRRGSNDQNGEGGEGRRRSRGGPIRVTPISRVSDVVPWLSP